MYLIPLGAFVGYLMLLLLIATKGPKYRLSRAFLPYLACMMIWSFSSFMARAMPVSTLTWSRVMIAAASGMSIMLYQFVHTFFSLSGRRWLRLGYGAYAGVIVITLSTRWVVPSARVVQGLYYLDRGLLMVWVVAAMGVWLILALYHLIRGYSSEKDRSHQNRIRYLLVGVGFIVVGSSTNVISALTVYPIDIAANLVNAVLITYATLRYQLLDIAFIIRKSLAYSLFTSLIAVTYLFTVFVFTSIFRILIYTSLIPALLVASAIAVALQPMRDRVQSTIDRLFFRESYDAHLMLQELGTLAVSILDISRLATLLLDRFATTMHISQTCIMLKERDTAEFRVVASQGLADAGGEEVIFREDHPVARWMADHRQLLTHREMDMWPQFRALWNREWEDLDRLGAELFVPLLVRGDLIGMLILGAKRSETSYTRDEQMILAALANQTAVAVQNAWLYSALERSLEEMKQMQAQLIQAEKLSALGEMIGGVAHEINNPLTAVIGYSQLLLTANLDSQIRADIGQILEAGLRVKRIVGSLLDFSRQHPSQKEYLDINRVVSDSLDLRAHDLTTNNIQVEADLAIDLPHAMADRHQLQQVFVNIINNASQAMAQQSSPGVLAVKTCRGENDTILITFQDTGPGIPKAILGRIFDPFFTTKEVGQGTGLGLSVSYGIIREHEGRIWAESPAPDASKRDGQGAIFFIELPISRSTLADE